MFDEGEWETKKHSADYNRQWRKVHLGNKANTLEILAIEATENANGDLPMSSCALDQIAEEESIASVGVDTAYDTKLCN